MEVTRIREDDDDEFGMSMETTTGKTEEVENTEKWTEEDDDYDNLAPLYNDDEGEVDDSEAFVLEVDALEFMEKIDNHKGRYDVLLEFAVDCRRKCALELFRHPGLPVEIRSIEGKPLERDFYQKITRLTIDEYNMHSKGGKLKLERLMKLVATMDGLYYMTFSARDEETGRIGTYQAASFVYKWLSCLLGLFIDRDADKVLAILSLKGADEDLEAKRKYLTDLMT